MKTKQEQWYLVTLDEEVVVGPFDSLSAGEQFVMINHNIMPSDLHNLGFDLIRVKDATVH